MPTYIAALQIRDAVSEQKKATSKTPFRNRWRPGDPKKLKFCSWTANSYVTHGLRTRDGQLDAAAAETTSERKQDRAILVIVLMACFAICIICVAAQTTVPPPELMDDDDEEEEMRELEQSPSSRGGEDSSPSSPGPSASAAGGPETTSKETGAASHNEAPPPSGIESAIPPPSESLLPKEGASPGGSPVVGVVVLPSGEKGEGDQEQQFVQSPGGAPSSSPASPEEAKTQVPTTEQFSQMDRVRTNSKDLQSGGRESHGGDDKQPAQQVPTTEQFSQMDRVRTNSKDVQSGGRVVVVAPTDLPGGGGEEAPAAEAQEAPAEDQVVGGGSQEDDVRLHQPTDEHLAQMERLQQQRDGFDHGVEGVAAGKATAMDPRGRRGTIDYETLGAVAEVDDGDQADNGDHVFHEPTEEQLAQMRALQQHADGLDRGMQPAAEWVQAGDHPSPGMEAGAAGAESPLPPPAQEGAHEAISQGLGSDSASSGAEEGGGADSGAEGSLLSWAYDDLRSSSRASSSSHPSSSASSRSASHSSGSASKESSSSGGAGRDGDFMPDLGRQQSSDEDVEDVQQEDRHEGTYGFGGEPASPSRLNTAVGLQGGGDWEDELGLGISPGLSPIHCVSPGEFRSSSSERLGTPSPL